MHPGTLLGAEFRALAKFYWEQSVVVGILRGFWDEIADHAAGIPELYAILVFCRAI